jgi:ribonucleoside-diphosphate reductase alpha chain
MSNIYEALSKERKELQAAGEMADWWSTGAWQLFKAKYLYEASTPREQYSRIARTLAQYIEGRYPDWWYQVFPEGYTWYDAFFDQMWSGNLSGSTPVIGNTGTNRGFSVSCSGNVLPNSINGIYDGKREIAVLTKHSFGTASFLGHIQARGTLTDKKQKAAGVLPVIQGVVHDMQYVIQGGRRGAWAGYLPIEHGDFGEVADYLKDAPDGLNIGWNWSDNFTNLLNSGDAWATDRWQHLLHSKMLTGKGYMAFMDKINRRRPQMYKDLGLEVVAPQLCNEIHLHSSEALTYTCVLSSLNAVHWNRIKDTRAGFIMHVFLDCVAEDFIQKAKGIKGLEKAVEFTELGRPTGLGICGFHTYLQQERIPFESMEAHLWNNELSNYLRDQTLEASQWLASVFGEPEWCRGYGVRNTHRTAIAPTKSSALLMAGISEGINPDPAMTFTQLTPAGEVDRANPILLQLMKDRGVYDDAHMKSITDMQGSVQHVDWLDTWEKLVFRTGFEIDQRAILRLGAQRQKRICQGQSLNLWFSADEDEEYVAEIHQEAVEDENITGIYYAYSKAGVTASKGECIACQ